MTRILSTVAKAAVVLFVLVETAAIVEWAVNAGKLPSVTDRYRVRSADR